MFHATITILPSRTSGCPRKTVANALKAAAKEMEKLKKARVELFEDGLSVLVTFGDTPEQAIKEAMDMSRKARRGGGR